ncbi:acetylhydrolase [Pseudoalteromonas sp. MMG010]|uniref:alpha/beta hydrolase family protein n=1 Tax=Pseudoalteromonas sp. MMG010 TaxID=2822685 RepID=UPI001B3A5A18|nr:alpha/beta hydrolase-fold protein [Pseudoalteromonas sp. MMG010]MBQ4834178.1 acetylhydrolase [Pseudoalteromonas sp. MMG010]
MTTYTLKRIKKAVLFSAIAFYGNTTQAVEIEQLYPPLTSEVLPELAASGTHAIGVKTLQVINPQQFDPQSQTHKDRPLTLEVWYPANISSHTTLTHYHNVTRSGKAFNLQAAAMRDAPADTAKKYPVIVLSHGYTGYRTIMYYLGEHLASHGYIVAAIDHTDSTNAEIDFKHAPFAGFFSTLLNRSKDQQFVLNYFNKQAGFLSEQVDSNNSAIIGYSMGGYGAINTVGGCYDFNSKTVTQFTGLTESKKIKQIQQLLNSCAGGQYSEATVDKSIKAMVALAPWGGQYEVFAKTALKNISVPSLYIAGDLDDISGYKGIKGIYNNTGSKSKYLLTYKNARHNIAVHPATAIAMRTGELDLGHYYEPSWSTRTLNETNKHFILAMMDCHVKKISTQCRYLNLPFSGDQLDHNGMPTPAWTGFDNRFSTGMTWQTSSTNNPAISH